MTESPEVTESLKRLIAKKSGVRGNSITIISYRRKWLSDVGNGMFGYIGFDVVYQIKDKPGEKTIELCGV